jgi:alcohol dehydrogenase
VAITGSHDKAAQVGELGADHVVRPDGQVGEALMAAGAADVIVCTTNSAAHVSQALAGLLPEGRLVNAGAIEGPIEIDGVGLFQAESGLLGSIQGDRPPPRRCP